MLDTSTPNPILNDSASFNNSVGAQNITMNNMVSSSRPTIAKLVQTRVENFQNSQSDEPIEYSSVAQKKITYEFKVILLGNVSVGKTSIFNRFISNQFDFIHQCTIKAEFKSKIINVDKDSQAKLKIWDTSGDERYRTITRQYYRDAHGVILVYDVSDKGSFDGLNEWIAEIKNSAPKNCVIILAGNKIDLTAEREVTKEEAEEYAESIDAEHVEVSAKLGQNVFLLFEKLAHSLNQCIENKNELILHSEESITLDKKRERNKAKKISEKSGCC